MKRILLLTIILCLFSCHSIGNDETIDDFIGEIQTIISNKDYQGFIRHLSENIKYADDLGKKAFIKKSRIEEKNSPFWNVLEKAFHMPYKRINDSLFEIPDFERTFSENDKFIVIRDTYLYAEPNEESSRLFQINKGFSFREPNNDFNIKTYTSIDTNQILISCNECWLKILYQNTTGYIKVANIYGIYMDYPTFFVENNEGNWKISM